MLCGESDLLLVSGRVEDFEYNAIFRKALKE